MPLSRREAVELGLIAATTAVIASTTPYFPARLPLGYIALGASALLLAQGLVRDLVMKYGPQPAACPIDPNAPKGTCMCMESTLGTVGLFAGVIALLAGFGKPIAIVWFAWPLLALATMLFGFFIKNIVIDWKTKRIRRERNHFSVRF